MRDYADLIALRERLRAEKVQDEASHLRQVAQAEVPMTALTGVREWDLYLQVVQAMIEGAEEKAAAEAAALEDPLLLDREAMLRRKVELIKIRQSIATMEELRDLPKMLVEGAQEAKELLEKHGIEN